MYDGSAATVSSGMENHASHAAAPAAMPAARPRISADAFRALSAKLKTAAVPPVVVAAPNPPAAAVEASAPAPIAAPLAESVAPQAVQQPTSFVPPVVEVAAAEQPEAAPLDVAPPDVSAIDSTPQPVALHVEAVEPVVDVQAQPEDNQPAAAVPEAVQPETVQPEVVQPEAADVVLHKLETISPEEAKQAAARVRELATAPAVPEEEVSTEKILEENWRLLLAKPTAEDRAQYLREAAEIQAEENIDPLPHEFDLSRVAPAEDVEAAPEDGDAASLEAEASTPPTGQAREFPVNLPAGQDTAEVARSLLDMMAAGATSGLPHERALAADTLLRLVPRLDLKPLIMLAERLSKMDNPPPLLVTRLIRDPRLEVCGPLLEDCMHIPDRDLQAVVEEGDAGKLRMIARRRKLTRIISDALIKVGDASVMLTLVRNMEAEISHEGFTALIAAAGEHEDLLAPLSTRPDLSAPFAFELFWHAPAQLRRFILSRFLTDSETLTKILKITLATRDDEDEHGEREPMNQHVVVEALERASRGRHEEAADELAAALQVSPATVARVLADPGGEPLVVLLKTAGYARAAVLGVLSRMQKAEMPLISRDRDLQELQYMFETLSFNKARILLTYWDWAQSKTGPYAAAH